MTTTNVVDLQAVRDAQRSVRPSNSGPSLIDETACAPGTQSWQVAERGIDTIRLRWREPGAGYADRLERIEHRRGPRGECFVQLDGARYGAFGDGVCYVEGRAALLLEGSESHRLVAPAELGAVADAAAERLAELGIRVDAGHARTARIDCTAQLEFADPLAGQAMLRGLLHTDLPWLKAGGEGIKRNSAETVFWRSAGRGKRVLRRTYDKGVEAGIAPPGMMIRDECQTRFPKSRERWLSLVSAGDCAELYARRHIARLVDPDTADVMVVANTADAIELLSGLVDDDTLGRRLATSLAGFLVLGHRHASRPTYYRNWSMLSKLGIAVNDAQPEPRPVPLGNYYRAMLESWAA